MSGRQHQPPFRLQRGLFAVAFWVCCLPVFVGPCAAAPQDSQDPPPDITSDVPPDPVDEQDETTRRQVNAARQSLLDESNDLEQSVRDDAAAELLSIEASEAVAALEEALRSGRPAVVTAVLHAMRSLAVVRADLLTPTIDALLASDASQREALVLQLARHGDAAVGPLANALTETASGLPARLNAISALGTIRTRQSATALIVVLDSERGEPAEITNHACAALTRFTGLEYGTDVVAWREWWRRTRDLSDDAWSREIVDAFSARIVALETEKLVQHEANQQVVARLIETYRELFASISREDEQQRLEPLLNDPLTGVRLFAVSRIERMLRDGVRIDDPIQQRLLPMLTDADPEIRRRAALVLEQLAHPSMAMAIATAMPNESNPQVIAEYLGIFVNHPNIVMLAPVLARLGNPAFTDVVARGAWNLLNGPAELRQQIAGEHREAIRGAIQLLPEDRRSPPVLRVFTSVCADDTLPSLLPNLDSEDESMRRAVAQGLARRGPDHIQPLLDRAGDPAIYPVAVNALAAGEASVQTLRSVAELRPPDPQATSWPAAINRVMGRLASDEIIAADDMLTSMEHVTGRIRADALAAALPRIDAESVELKVNVTTRLCTLLLGLKEPARAHTLLEALNGAPTTPELQSLRFRAAALSERYDRAAEFDAAAASWIALAESLIGTGSDDEAQLALRLSAEIQRRFEGQLSEQQQAYLEVVLSALPARDGGGGGGGGDGESNGPATANANAAGTGS